VRWTEQRNFEAVLDLLAAGKLDTTPLISHRFELERAVDAYALLASGEPSLGILLGYPGHATTAAALRETERRSALPGLLQQQISPVGGPAGPTDRVSPSPVGGPAGPTDRVSSSPVGGPEGPTGAPRVAFLGAGNYAGRILIPAFKYAGAALDTIVSASGVSAAHHAKKHGFAHAASDASAAVTDANVDAVAIATRHNLHAAQVLDALRAGKHVFCEKPLCLTLDELTGIEQFFADAKSPPMLMVGFNRRFAPQVVKIKSLLAGVSAPASFIMTVNAGVIPAESWIQDPAVGGGRLIGEGCHFIDLLRHLAGASINGFDIAALGEVGGPPRSDNFSLTLRFVNGSIGTINYFANGNKSFPKERLEVFVAGRVLQLDNFRALRGWGWPGFKRNKLWRQDKGQNACAAAFVRALRDGTAAPIPLAEILETSRVAIEASQRL
jgi:predicted dehydrogenase